jgi:hypothetical protein
MSSKADNQGGRAPPPPPAARTAGNRLAGQASLYLRQHQHDPVAWQPWDEAALALARDEDRPIFLSIGYSACHWCHVMAHESFADPETARLLNDAFVCIKVDREERPDVDDIYMTATQMLTGAGGWPLSLFLTPRLEPFYAGTYFPPQDRAGLPGFQRVVETLAQLWRERRGDLETNAARTYAAVRRELCSAQPVAAGANAPALANLAAQALVQLRAGFDPRRGGFSAAPKFPPHGALRFLQQARERLGDSAPDLPRLIGRTLEEMAAGGICDQAGGGFHRYAVDGDWTVPHFEKMLYDNALLAGACIRAWRQDPQPLWRHVACQTLDCLLRDFRRADGLFAASQDADAPGGEGRFHTWTRAELRAALPDASWDLARQVYDLPEHGHHDGRLVLRLRMSHDALAAALGLAPAVLLAELARIGEMLRACRDRRPPPARDDKAVAAWNAFAISAFALAGRALGERRYLEAAADAGQVLRQAAVAPAGLPHLLGTEAPRAGAGFLDDWAAGALACLDLYECTGENAWRDTARTLVEGLRTRFRDPAGGFFASAPEHADTGLRPKPVHDGALPAGASLAVAALIRAGRHLGEAAWLAEAEAELARDRERVERFPLAFLDRLAAAELLLDDPLEAHIAAPAAAATTDELLAPLFARLPGNRIIRWEPPAPGRPGTVSFCRHGRCLPPAKTPAQVAAVLAASAAAPAGGAPAPALRPPDL